MRLQIPEKNHYVTLEWPLRVVAHLKSGWGVIVGIWPSITPLSLIQSTPPGSMRALRRSRTDGLQKADDIFGDCILGIFSTN